ncbi:hypothetical protein I548_5072 [Mycobacterium intracellulare]|nr:hypothetical protein I548_5072 [Mycobacterium intracellulare]
MEADLGGFQSRLPVYGSAGHQNPLRSTPHSRSGNREACR